MTQTTKPRSLLDESNYRNPRYAQEAAELEALEKGPESAATDNDNPEVNKQEPNHDWKKRYADLQRYHQEQTKKHQREVSDLKAAQVPKFQAPKTQEDLAAFKQQNPEMFAVIQTMAHDMASSLMQENDQKLAAIQGDLIDTKQDRMKAQLRLEHPDFDQIIASDEFHNWAGTQNPQLQAWIYENPDNPDLASNAIRLYKAEKGMGTQNQVDQTNSQNADMAVKVNSPVATPDSQDRNHPAYIWKASEINSMSIPEFEKWEEHIDLAQREGRFDPRN